MKIKVAFAFCISSLLYSVFSAKKNNEINKAARPTDRAPSININLDKLPRLERVLEDLEMLHRLKEFVRLGVTETRHLIRLQRMDFQMMMLDWKDMEEKDVKKLKDKIAAIVEDAAEEVVVSRPEVTERSKLNYGRIYANGFVQSFEYLSATFGGKPPIGPLNMVLADPLDICDDPIPLANNGNLVVAVRGNCTFLKKAINARKTNATVLAIINTEDRLESASSGLLLQSKSSGAHPREEEEEVYKYLQDIAVITLSNTSLAPLLRSLRSPPLSALSGDLPSPKSSPRRSVESHVVPLKCGMGEAACRPLLAEESSLVPEITWGRLTVTSSNRGGGAVTCDFLTSTFGGQLPASQFPISISVAPERDACATVDTSAASSSATDALLVYRGGCQFDVKAKYVEDLGATLGVVVDGNDTALQRLGGRNPLAGHVGIPLIYITSSCGEHIERRLNADPDPGIPQGFETHVWLHLQPEYNTVGSDAWIDVAYTAWSEEESERIAQYRGLAQKYKAHNEIVLWLRRQEVKLLRSRRTRLEDEAESEADVKVGGDAAVGGNGSQSGDEL